MKHMVRGIITTVLVTLMAVTAGFGQETWSLERCIEYAIEQSLTVERAEVNQQFAEVDLKQSKQARWPTVNARAAAGLNFGRVINPSTNTFETDDSYFNSFQIGTGVLLYGGNQINNSIKRSNLALEAAGLDLRQSKIDLALDVALAYLNVLFGQENLTNAETTLELSQSQLEQIDKLIAAGSRPENERYDILAQISLDEGNVVQRENEIEQAFLALKQLMMLDPEFEMVLEQPDLQEELLTQIDEYTFTSVYSSALQTQPQIEAQQKRIESARLDEKIAKSNTYPSLSLGGSAGSNWSDLNERVSKREDFFIPANLYENGNPLPYERFIEGVPTETERTPYGTQISDNFGFGVQLDLTIPIYNNYVRKAQIEQAKLNTILAVNQDEQIKQLLKTDIQNALQSAEAAREQLKASQAALDAADVAFQNSQRRFDLGTLNSYDFINARNRFAASQINLTISKFDYVFRLIVLEYYLGRAERFE